MQDGYRSHVLIRSQARGEVSHIYSRTSLGAIFPEIIEIFWVSSFLPCQLDLREGPRLSSLIGTKSSSTIEFAVQCSSFVLKLNFQDEEKYNWNFIPKTAEQELVTESLSSAHITHHELTG